MKDKVLFVNWNKSLFSYFFPNSLDEDEEVTLYINRNKLDEIGLSNSLGGYDGFMRLIMLSSNDRQAIFGELWRSYAGNRELSREQKRIIQSGNIFDFATIYNNEVFFSNLSYPLYFVYVVFAVLMGSECYDNKRVDIGQYITERLRRQFPNHTNRRAALDELFNALAEQYPWFHARKLTAQVYIGLIKYQLGLSRAQVENIEKAMFNSGLSEHLPYNTWVDTIRDYVDQQLKDRLNESKKNQILKQRISDLREHFDPSLYKQRHHAEVTISRGHFVLAVYEDEYSEENDRLVLLTDINNKTISNDSILIREGGIDRIGEYAEYNVNHVLIGGADKAEMRTYSLTVGDNLVSSRALGNIVTFSRCNSNYLIQNDYPRRGNETYILVRRGHDEEWRQWLDNHDSPQIKSNGYDRALRIFGNGWDMYTSYDIRSLDNTGVAGAGMSITMGGGFRCVGKNNVYLITALPYFEFPESVELDRLSIYMNMDGRLMNKDQYNTFIADGNKLVIDLRNPCINNHSSDIGITLEYRSRAGRVLRHHEDFSVIGQDVLFSNEDVLFKMNMWGEIATYMNAPYMRGMKVYNAGEKCDVPEGTGYYQNLNCVLDIFDPRFYLVNLIAADCSMRKGFSVTEKILKKCIRYASTRLGVDVAKESAFYKTVKFLLINGCFINADFEHGLYQPVPPTFIKSSVGPDIGHNYFLLVGSYTRKFLFDLKDYCARNRISIVVKSVENDNSIGEKLLPPIILIQSSFNPEAFINETNSICFFNSEDVAKCILESLPTYSDYESTLTQVPSNVFNARLDDSYETDFPRVRFSGRTGFGVSRWIEMTENNFYRITVPDVSWADLFCMYKKQKTICIKDNHRLYFSDRLHLPVMMQRALYMLNFGTAKKEKAFICNNDGARGYYDLIKCYDINDVPGNGRLDLVDQAITGRRDSEQNDAIRDCRRSSNYKLFIWNNRNKNSNNPRSLIVMTDYHGGKAYCFGTRRKDAFELYLRGDLASPEFRMINNGDINAVFSRFLIANKQNALLERIIVDVNRIREVFEFEVNNEKKMQLPPREEYDVEELKII